jgi:hypothetical protein
MNTNNKKATASKAPNLAIIIAAAVAAVILLNAVVCFIPDGIRRLDITSSDSYTLSDSTEKYLSELDEKVTLYVLDADGSDVKFEYFLDRIDNCTENLTVEWIDSERSADKLEPLGIKPDQVAPYILICEGEKRSTAVSYAELVSYRTENSTLKSFIGSNEMTAVQYEYMKQSLATQAQSSSEYASQYAAMLEALIYDVEKYFNAEPFICRIVEYVTVDVIPARYTLTGHGETDISKTEIGYYLSETVGMNYKTLDLTKVEKIPEDAVSIIVMAPTEDISSAEADALLSFLNGGGQMTFFTTDGNIDMPNLMSVMTAYGLSANKGTVGDAITVHVKSVENIENTENTENTENGEGSADGENADGDKNESDSETKIVYVDDVGVIINTAHSSMAQLKGMNVAPVITRGNSINMTNSAGFKLTPVLTTKDTAYVGENKEELGARALAAVSEKENGGTLLWFTGAESFTVPILENTDDSEQMATIYNNCALVISSLALAPFSYESTVTLPEAKYYGERLMYATETSFVLYAVVIVVLTVALSVTGIIIWYKRKKA